MVLRLVSPDPDEIFTIDFFYFGLFSILLCSHPSNFKSAHRPDLNPQLFEKSNAMRRRKTDHMDGARRRPREEVPLVSGVNGAFAVQA